MSRSAPRPSLPQRSCSLTDASTTSAGEKRAASLPIPPPPPSLRRVAVIGTAVLFGGGYFLFANAKHLAPPPPEDEKSKIAYVSMDEIKANAAKRAEATAAIKPKSSVRRDVPRTDARGSTESIDGVQACVLGVAIEREYRVGILIYRRRNPLLRITVAFQMSTLGQTRAYDFDGDQFPLAKMIDETDRPYHQLETGGFDAAIQAPFGSTIESSTFTSIRRSRPARCTSTSNTLPSKRASGSSSSSRKTCTTSGGDVGNSHSSPVSSSGSGLSNGFDSNRSICFR